MNDGDDMEFPSLGERNVPRRLGENLDRVVDGLGGNLAATTGASRTKGASGLFSRWADLVGAEIAAHARPHGLQDGRLLVVTDDPAWASQLRWLANDLMARIAAADGPQLAGIVVRVQPR